MTGHSLHQVFATASGALLRPSSRSGLFALRCHEPDMYAALLADHGCVLDQVMR
jgi:hypothetical protein